MSEVHCQICSHTGQTLARHLKAAHGITANEYRARFPDARIRTEGCESNRRAAISKAHLVKPRAGLKKTIQCPSCGTPREVGFSFGPRHESRCPPCLQKSEDAHWASKIEGSEYVTCLECGHRAENLTSHIQNAHPEWIGRYPGQIVAFNSSIRDKSYLKGTTHSEETKAKMSASAGWNRGLTKDTDPRVANAAAAMVGRPSWNTGLTKADHPSLRATSEKMVVIKTGIPNDAVRLDLVPEDFESYLEADGTIDRRQMALGMAVCEATLTKYMTLYGLRPSMKNVAARVARDVGADRFREMARKNAEIVTVRLTTEQLEPYRLANGKVVLARAMRGLGHVPCIIKRECARLGIPTYTGLIRQTLCLDAVSAVLGGAPYEQEWRSSAFLNPRTGQRFKFDGFFPSNKLIVEFHGYQHWTFPNVFHRTEGEFLAGQERDAEKEVQVRNAGYAYLILRQDEPFADQIFIKEKWLEALGKL